MFLLFCLQQVMLTLIESLDLSDAKCTELLQRVIVGIIEKLKKAADITKNNSESQVCALFIKSIQHL